MKKIMIAAVIIASCIVGLISCAQGHEGDAAKIVGEYTGDQLAGFEDILQSSDSFDLGVNKYGQPVFADREKAYEQLRITCKDAIEAVREAGKLPKLEIDNMPAYSSIGAELSGDDELLQKAAFIGVFYSIYCHSDEEFYE